MNQTLKIAAVQMMAQPAPTAERVARAAQQVRAAAQAGADVVVLPEIFNTGYEYSTTNYERAETLDGPTVTWMKQAAAEHQIYLAGSILLRDGNDIFNAMLLIAPDGQLWRYDKNYPWAWERAYFKNGQAITIADTPLGKFGMLICADVTHTDLWAAYAGKVQAMLVSSCPPLAGDLTITLPDGEHIRQADHHPILRRVRTQSSPTFGDYLRRQTTHLGVPLVNTTGTGHFRSHIPRPKMAVLLLGFFFPRIWKHFKQAEQIEIETDYFNETYISDAAGQVLAQVPPETEGFVMAEVNLPAAPPPAKGKPPRYGMPLSGYGLDWFFRRVTTATYRQHQTTGVINKA